MTHMDPNVVVKLLSRVPLFFDSMDCSPPGSSVPRISQARILEWIAISSSRGSSWPRDWTHASCIGRRILYHSATREAHINSHTLNQIQEQRAEGEQAWEQVSEEGLGNQLYRKRFVSHRLRRAGLGSSLLSDQSEQAESYCVFRYFRHSNAPPRSLVSTIPFLFLPMHLHTYTSGPLQPGLCFFLQSIFTPR